MINIIAIGAGIFIIAVVMAMTGRGGGNFYVPLLIASGIPIYQAATDAQLILVATSISSMLIFQKHRTVDWKLALVIDPPTDIMAFIGGYYAHLFRTTLLKFIFGGLLVLSGFLMLRPVGGNSIIKQKKCFGCWLRKYGEYEYKVNLWLAIPVTAATGFVAGMVGISGGSFKVPLMVLICGVPVRIAVGTSSAMVAVTALMGFLGHSIRGDFNSIRAIPLAIIAILGGIIGGNFSIKTKPQKLKHIFAYSTLIAAVFMILNAILSV